MSQSGINVEAYKNRIQDIGSNKPYGGEQYTYLIYFLNGVQRTDYTIIDQIKRKEYISKKKQ